jgi:hypothetical protein
VLVAALGRRRFNPLPLTVVALLAGGNLKRFGMRTAIILSTSSGHRHACVPGI